MKNNIRDLRLQTLREIYGEAVFISPQAIRNPFIIITRLFEWCFKNNCVVKFQKVGDNVQCCVTDVNKNQTFATKRNLETAFIYACLEANREMRYESFR